MNKNPAMASDNNQPFGQCRCCLDFGYHKDISQPYYRNGVRIIYREVFLNTLNFRLSKNKYLSNMICKGCIRKLNNAMDFRELVVATERQLLARIGCYPVGVNIPVSQHKTSSAEEKINDTIIKKEEDDGWSNDGGDIDVQDDFEEQDVSSGPSTSTQALINNMSPCVVKLEKLNEEIEKDVEQDDTSKERNVNTQSATPANVPTRTEMHIADIVEATCSLMHDMTEKIKEKDVKLPTKKLHDLTEKIKEKDVRPPTKKIDKNTGPAAIGLTTIETTETVEEAQPSTANLKTPSPVKGENNAIYKTLLKSPTINIDKTNTLTQSLDDVEKTYKSKATKKKDPNHNLNKIHTKKLSCTLCAYTTRFHCKFKSHLKVHSLTSFEYICDKCAYISTKRTTIIRHIKCHKDENPYACKICDEDFNTRSNFIRHTIKHTGEKPFICEICDKMFTHSYALKCHAEIHTREKPYACEICDARFVTKSDVSKHIMKTHTSKKFHTCEICDAKFDRRENLNCHINIHTDEKKYSCKICDKRYGSKSALGRHTKTHTDKKLYACEICDLKFTRSYDLKCHFRRHTGDKRYACKICDKKFYREAEKRRHMVIHTREKPSACEICDARFFTKSDFNKHMRIHTGEKVYTCEICDMIFIRPTDFKTHIRTHTGEKPYACNICNKMFAKSTNVRLHARIHK